MKLIIYEFKKILSHKYVCVAFVVLFVINAAFCVYLSEKDNARCTYDDDIKAVFDLYEKSPQRLVDYREELKKLSEEYLRLEIEAMRKGNYDYKSPRMPSTLTDNPYATDNILLSILFGRVEYNKTFPERTQKIIENANKLLKNASLAGETDGFNITYQQNLINVYSGVKSADIKLEYIRGYDKYFGYTASDYLLVLLVVLVVPAVFLGEYTCGTALVVRSSRNGRIKTVLAKFVSLFIFVAIAVLVFQAAAFLVYGIYYGYSSLSNAVQAVPMFETCPLIITVGVALAIGLACKTVFVFAVSSVLLALSMLTRSYKLTFLFGVVTGGVNYALYAASYIDAHNFFQQINLFALTDISRFLGKYNAINLFGRLFEQLSSSFLLYAALILLSVFTAARMFVKNKTSVSFKRIIKLNPPRISVCPGGLLGYEFRKAAGNWLIVASLVLLVIVKIMISSSEYRKAPSFSDSVYKYYMTRLEGEWTQEKSDFIASERARFNEIIYKKDEMDKAHFNGEIDFDEYSVYINEYYDAKAKTEPFVRVENRNDYLTHAASMGKDVAFVYDTGYNKLFFAGADMTLLLLVAVMLAGIFADEYQYGFDKILRASPRGRRRVCRAKFLYAFIVATAAFLAFSAVDAVNLISNYDFAPASYPVASIPAFGGFNGLSLSVFIVLYYMEKYIAYLIFAAFLCGLSLLLKKTVTALFVAAGIYLLPYVLKSMITEKFDYIDMTNLLSPGGYLVKSSDIHLINAYGLFAALLILALVTAVITDIISVRRFCKTY